MTLDAEAGEGVREAAIGRRTELERQSEERRRDR